MMHKMVNGFSWSLFSCCGSHYSVFVLFFNSIFYAFDFFFFFLLSLSSLNCTLYQKILC